MRLSAILWDMDGTLFDTYPPIREILGELFAAQGVTVDPLQVAALLTDTLGGCLATLSAENGLDAAVMAAAYQDILAAEFTPAMGPPLPGVLAVCRRVQAVGGCNLIFTHREHASLAQFLDHYQVADLFTDTLTADQGYPRKPDPAGFLALAERNGFNPLDVLAVGDRDLDIQAGINAGMATCFYAAADFPGGPPTPSVQPDVIINHYDALADFLFG